jgi:UDP-2,3-diacylglucosamine pyrophosphatase LpxH
VIKTEWQKFVVLADFHSPFYNENAVALALEYVKRIRPHFVFLNGDIVDCLLLSRFIRVNTPFHRFEEEHKQNVILFNRIMDACGDAEVTYIEGNHELRLPKFLVVNAPTLENFPGLSIPEMLNLKKHGVKYVEAKRGQMGIYKWTDNLIIAHGERYSITGANNVAKQNFGDFGQSVITSHNHSEGTWRERKGNGKDYVALVTSCLCDPQAYRALDKWSRGFVEGEINLRTGHFRAEHVRITGENFDELLADNVTLKIKHFNAGFRVVEEK